jgi:hypothetical protein
VKNACSGQFPGRFAYHFTSLENLGSVLKSGLLCTNEKNRRGITHVNVAAASIQGRRHSMVVPCASGTVVHDYVPFYFSKKTPMQLGVINKKNLDQELVIYFAVPLGIMDNHPGVVFTDASANTGQPPNFYPAKDSHLLSQLNWVVIDSGKWSWPDDETRHQKMAELLIPGGVSMQEVDHIIVWDAWAADHVRKIFSDAGVKCPPIRFDTGHYFTTFYARPERTIVTGPYLFKALCG